MIKKFFGTKEKRKKGLFFLAVAVAGLLIFIFNLLTPMMTDDLFYRKTVSEASSLWELILQEHEQYMTWTGRSVCHMLLRIFLSMDIMVFKVANSLAFVLLTLLVYWNVEHRERYDLRVYLLANLLIWMFGVAFSQTVLWETGACNYLWGTTIILGFVTLYRYGLARAGHTAEEERQKGRVSKEEQKAEPVFVKLVQAGQAIEQEKAGRHTKRWKAAFATFGMLAAGIPAGWCNENTSGGGILMVLLCLSMYLYGSRKENGKKPWIHLHPWMITGLMGQLAGFALMVLAPGNMQRAGVQEEEHSGWFAYVSRFQKITLAIRDNFLILLMIFLVLFIIVRYQRENLKIFYQYSKNALLWALVFLATCYALVFTPEPMPRAYFGAGIFLILAVVQLYVDVSEQEKLFGMMKTGLASVLFLIMFFIYMDCGANLARIYREYRERDVYLSQMAEEGAREVTVPMLRPAFENKYSDGYNSDIQEDPGYWVNVAYAQYYGFDSVAGVPREGWTEY